MLRAIFSGLRAESNLVQRSVYFSSNTLASLYCTMRQTPRRALLYVPGSDDKKIKKAAQQVQPDTICLDVEDGVAMSKKSEARQLIRNLLSAALDFGRSEVAVRVNPLSSGLAGEDLACALSARRLPHALVLPKVEEAEEVAWVFRQVSDLVQARHAEMSRPLALITMCETAKGLLNLRFILDEAARLSGDVMRPAAVILGGDDFAASIGARRTKASLELLHARQSLVVHCAAYGLQAIDIVQIDFKDVQALEAEAREGAGMGFAGKQVIHPLQVPVVHAAFSPTPEEAAEARELVEAFEKEEAAGRGAFTFKGRMIDMPSVLQARNVLARTGVQVSDAHTS